MGDTYDIYDTKQADTIIMNPGSFARGGFKFSVYYPASRMCSKRFVLCCSIYVVVKFRMVNGDELVLVNTG
jgi:hypothetical protein